MTRQVFPQWQITIDLISRDMVETDIILMASLNQRVSADNIGLNKWIRILQ